MNKYYIYGISQDAVRGCHAHKQLQQVLICVQGSCKVMLDDGTELSLPLYYGMTDEEIDYVIDRINRL